MIVTKEELRKRILKERLDQDPAKKAERDRLIRERLSSLPEFQRAKVILLYYPIKGEPDLRPLFPEILADGTLVLPKVRGEDLALVRVEDLRKFKPGAFGILEPEGDGQVDPEEVDLAVVPGVVFDRECFRIGFGKGFYDRLLRRIKAPKVGVAYSFQVVRDLPKDPWDVPLDLVLTEDELIRRL